MKNRRIKALDVSKLETLKSFSSFLPLTIEESVEFEEWNGMKLIEEANYILFLFHIFSITY